MLIQHGDVSSLAGKNWFLLELRSEQTAEITLRRLAQEVPGIFRDSPVEILAPVRKRDLNTYELFTGPYIYIRSDNFKAVLRVKTVTGLVGLLTEGDSGRSTKAIPAPDDYVQDLIRKDNAEFEARSFGIGIGSFVRILDGNVRDFCGYVTKVKGDRAEVTVELKTKRLFVSTPIKNLLNLDHVPPTKRVFYFSPLVDGLEDASLVAQDRHTLPAVVYTEAELAGEETEPHSAIARSSSITNCLRKAAKLGKTPRKMMESCVEALAKGNIKKRPKNLFILYCMLKEQYLALDKRFANWKEVRRGLSKGEYVTQEDVFACAERAGLEIPRFTPDTALCHDGRSSENRKKNRYHHYGWRARGLRS